jgi:hypothetical protein
MDEGMKRLQRCFYDVCIVSGAFCSGRVLTTEGDFRRWGHRRYNSSGEAQEGSVLTARSLMVHR